MRHGTSSTALVVPVLLAGVVGLAGCELAVGSWSAEARDDWSRSYTLAANGRFELSNTNGGITVEPSPDEQLHVRAQKIAKGATEQAAREALKQIEIAESASPTLVRLETKIPRSSFFGGGHAQVAYTVQVPASVAVKVENTNGRIQLSDLAGPVEAETTNGGVRGRGLRGKVRAGTTNGGVELDLASIAEGGVEVSTTNGGVNLAIPADARADLVARCTNGGIDTGGLDVETLESSRRRLDARLNGGGPRIQAETTNGGIRFTRR
jgi:hypothetical protein